MSIKYIHYRLYKTTRTYLGLLDPRDLRKYNGHLMKWRQDIVRVLAN